MGIILASASPRRQELLSFITNDFKVCPSNIPEIVPKNLKVSKHPEYLSKLKALDIANKYPDDIVIGADTAVIIGSEILGKPSDRDDAKRMLSLLSSKTHKVITGCTIINKGKAISFSVTTKVKFYKLDSLQIEEYINSSEPYDKAGSYAVQSKGGLFVKKIKGDYFNIVGLPIAKLYKKLNEVDI